MNTKRVASLVLGAAFAFAGTSQAHHSFSIFDSSKTRVFTGVVTRVNPG